MIVDKIGVSQIQAQTQTRKSGQVPALQFDADPVEPIRPYKPPSRDAAADQSDGRRQAERQQGQEQSIGTRAGGESGAVADSPQFTLDGQAPAETISRPAVGAESYSGLPGDMLAQQFGSAFDSESAAIPTSGGRGLARDKGASLYAMVQQTVSTPSVETRDNMDFWADGVVSQSRNPINLYI